MARYSLRDPTVDRFCLSRPPPMSDPTVSVLDSALAVILDSIGDVPYVVSIPLVGD